MRHWSSKPQLDPRDSSRGADPFFHLEAFQPRSSFPSFAGHSFTYPLPESSHHPPVLSARLQASPLGPLLFYLSSLQRNLLQAHGFKYQPEAQGLSDFPFHSFIGSTN